MAFYDLDFLEKTFIHYAKEDTQSDAKSSAVPPGGHDEGIGRAS